MNRFAPLAGVIAVLAATPAIALAQEHNDHPAPAAPAQAGAMMPCPMMAAAGVAMPMRANPPATPGAAPGAAKAMPMKPKADAMPMKGRAMPKAAEGVAQTPPMCMGPKGPQAMMMPPPPATPPSTPPAN
jgi:hypothetical protein